MDSDKLAGMTKKLPATPSGSTEEPAEDKSNRIVRFVDDATNGTNVAMLLLVTVFCYLNAVLIGAILYEDVEIWKPTATFITALAAFAAAQWSVMSIISALTILPVLGGFVYALGPLNVENSDAVVFAPLAVCGLVALGFWRGTDPPKGRRVTGSVITAIGVAWSICIAWRRISPDFGLLLLITAIVGIVVAVFAVWLINKFGKDDQEPSKPAKSTLSSVRSRFESDPGSWLAITALYVTALVLGVNHGIDQGVEIGKACLGEEVTKSVTCKYALGEDAYRAKIQPEKTEQSVTEESQSS